jgi:endonuclease-3
MAYWSREKVHSVLVDLEKIHGENRYIPRFDPMEELISCILSQHSSDARSFPAFTRLREAFPDWAELAVAPEPDVVALIRAAGLPNQKARSIQASLRLIYEEQGAFNLDFLRGLSTEQATAWLLKLPGVGPKTASIVLCFSMGRHTIPVDTHVFRLAKRLGILGERETETKAHDTLARKVRVGEAFRFHTTLIQHGRTICQARKPSCAECPVQDRCARKELP